MIVASRPTPIDKKAIARFVEQSLIPGIVRWLKGRPYPEKPIGSVHGIYEDELEIESVDGKETLYANVLVRAVPSSAKGVTVLGGSSSGRHWERAAARVDITLNMNGAFSASDILEGQKSELLGRTFVQNRLEPLSGCTHETCLPYGLYSILTHEVTHAAESMFKGKGLEYSYDHGPEGRVQIEDRSKYINDPKEVRAFLQQVVDETTRAAGKIHETAIRLNKDNRWLVDTSLKLSTTWGEIAKELNYSNKARILKAVYTALEAEGLLKTASLVERVAIRFATDGAPLAIRVAARYKEKKRVQTKDGDTSTVYIYSERQVQNRNKAKAERLQKLHSSIGKLRGKVKRDLRSSDPEKALTALAVGLIDQTFERVGNEESVKERGHFGVTGWQRKHVSFGRGKATIKYMGKSHVKQEKTVSDAAVLKALRNAYEAVGNDDSCLFEWEGGCVTPEKVNAYLKPFGITAKDIRGYHANSEMRKRLKGVRKGALPEDKKERKAKLKEEFKKALEETAEIVGHEPSTLKSQYLVPGLESSYLKDGTIIDKMSSSHEDEIPGGLADKKTPKDFDPTQLAKGVRIELEHTDDPDLAQEIAMDHLVEDPKYYDKLEDMESHCA